MNDDLDVTLDDDLLDDDDMDDTLVNNFEDLAKEEVEEEVAEEEKEVAEEPAPKHKPAPENSVPQARFNEERVKSKQKDATIAELQQQLEELKKSKAEMDQQPRANKSEELKSLRKQLKDAYFEEDDSAIVIQEQIDDLLEADVEARVERKLADREQARIERELAKAAESDQQMIDDSLAEWKADYPELDQASEEFDLELWNDAMTYQTALVYNRGMSGYDALQKAMAKFVGQPVEKAQVTKATVVIDDRTKRSVSRGIEQSRKSAPDIRKETIGNRSQPSGIDVTKMTQEQFDKLSKEDIDRLKGKIR